MRTWSILLRGETDRKIGDYNHAAYWPPPSMSCEATERRPPLVSNHFQLLGATFQSAGHGNGAFRVQLLSNLSSTTSKGSGPTLTPPEKGYSRTPIVKSTEEMIKANIATIRVCTRVLSKPNR